MNYDAIIVGTGFASSFFLHKFLKKNRTNKRFLVLEAGPRIPYKAQLSERRFLSRECGKYYTNSNSAKPWVFTRAFGGGSNCWFGTTPRMLPEDFRMYSKYGVANDWPISYGDLEPYYTEAEQIMSISGPQDGMPYPMSKPYPQPPHKFSTVDSLLRQQYPKSFFHLPTARSRVNLDGVNGRASCCGNGICHLCPIDSKFTIENGLSSVYKDARVDIVYEATVQSILYSANTATGVIYEKNGRFVETKADLIVLGANALFNPFILKRSGLDHPELGKGLCEQVGVKVLLEFDGLKNFHGSTITTGLGFNCLSGEHRRHRGGFLYHTVNRARNLRLERGRQLESIEIILAIEDLRQRKNEVIVDPLDENKPKAIYESHSQYAENTVTELPSILNKLLGNLPIEKLHIKMRNTESHIQGTTIMGHAPGDSIVDSQCLHHKLRNLVVLGSGNFPTASPANPTLTISALSLYAAEILAG